MAKPNELSEAYYLENFERLVKHVQSVYDDLLSKEMRDFISRFALLSPNGKRLFVRLSMRSKCFYRESKISYGEIQIPAAIKELEERGLLEVNPYVEFPDVLDPFTVSELKSFHKEYFLQKPPTGKRECLISSMEKLLLRGNEEGFYQFLFEKDQLLWPLFQEEWEMLKLLFFGSHYQDMEQFILEDLGIMKFEKIDIDKSTRLYQTWDQVRVTYDWILLHGELWEYCDEKDLEGALEVFKKIKKLRFEGSPLKRRYSRSANLMAKLLESCGELEKAMKIYKTSTSEPARERVARIYDKLGHPKKALRVCEDITKEPQSESERYFSLFFSEKMKRALGRDYHKQKRLKVPPETPINITWDKEVGVEKQVLDSLMKEQGMKGFYSENHYFPTLSALLFWDEFWSPGVGVFYHPFEQAPRDFRNGEFFIRMEKAIERKCDYWKSLSVTKIRKEVLSLYKEKEGTACILTNWKKTEKENMALILETMPREDLLKIATQILKDPRQYQSGLPDLFLVDSHGQYFFGEVKSPNDSIQTSQKRWIDKFLLWGIPFAIFRTL